MYISPNALENTFNRLEKFGVQTPDYIPGTAGEFVVLEFRLPDGEIKALGSIRLADGNLFLLGCPGDVLSSIAPEFRGVEKRWTVEIPRNQTDRIRRWKNYGLSVTRLDFEPGAYGPAWLFHPDFPRKYAGKYAVSNETIYLQFDRLPLEFRTIIRWCSK